MADESSRTARRKGHGSSASAGSRLRKPAQPGRGAAFKQHDDDRPRRRPSPPGYEVRAMAVRIVGAVLDRGRALDDALAAELGAANGLEARDRALGHLIAATVLRRHGELERAVASFIERPLPADRGALSAILLVAAAQLLVLGIAPHAAINIAVEQCRHDRKAGRFAKLANAVLRRVSEGGHALLRQSGGETASILGWLWSRWVAAYGETRATDIAKASLSEAALDITVKAAPQAWLERLGGVMLPTGTIRLVEHARVDELPGFAEGAWWVQDAAAALPARLLGEVRGLEVADLCAAPGGKAAQLAAAGAKVWAVDSSASRLARMRQNLERLQLAAELVEADAATWTPGRVFDAVLLDAPCTATGTIRRHPDILHLKRPTDLAKLAEVQARLLAHALTLVRPGGLLVYCVCSLEPEEGERQVEALLARAADVERVPVEPGEIAGASDWITVMGDLRTLPCHLPNENPRLAGMDGFYAARLRRRG